MKKLEIFFIFCSFRLFYFCLFVKMMQIIVVSKHLSASLRKHECSFHNIVRIDYPHTGMDVTITLYHLQFLYFI